MMFVTNYHPLGNPEQRFWPDNPAPAGTEAESNGTGVSLGMFFRVSVPGSIVGAYIYCRSGVGPITIVVHRPQDASTLYGGSNTPIKSQGFTPAAVTGWQRFDFTTPLVIPDTSLYYQIRYHQLPVSSTLYYGFTGNYSLYQDSSGGSAGLVNPPANLHFLDGIAMTSVFADATDVRQGQYGYTTDPNDLVLNYFNLTNYWIDPIFVPS